MMPEIFVLFSFFFGAIIGSFLNVVIWRLPREESLLGRSHCTQCDRDLSALDLVPIVSFLFLRGKCRGCGKSISIRYPIIEAVVGLLFALATWWVGFHDLVSVLLIARLWFILSVLVVVFMIDLEHYLILDVVVYPTAVVLLLFNLAVDIASHTSLVNLFSFGLGGVVAAASLFFVLWSIWFASKGKWIGFGDVKFMLVMGQMLAFPVAYLGFFLSFILGTVVSLPLLLLGKKQLQSKLPLGTFLSVSTFISLFLGARMVIWYLRLIGFDILM